MRFLSADEDGLGLPCSVLCLGHHPAKCVSLLPHLATASHHLLCRVPCGPNPENKVTCELRTTIWARFDVLWASLVAQTGEKLPAMRETWVQSLGWEDPLEKGTATHSSTLAWRIPWTEEPGGL